jgi:hypothetical protein
MSLRTMLEETRRVLDDTERLLHGASAEGSGQLSIAEIRRRNDAMIVAQSARAWRLKIGGSMASGFSNQERLQRFRDEDRDFEANTVQLQQARRNALRRRFAALGRLVSIDELTALDAETIRTWITERRLQRGNGDVLLPGLAASTRIQKARAGRGGEPIGVWSGRWRDAIRQQGTIEFV